MKKFFYISLFLSSIFTTFTINVTGQDLPMVCAGITTTYRVEGVPNSIFNWTITDPNGNPLPASNYTITGDLIEINWPSNLIGGIYTFSVVETTEFGCVGAPWDQQHIILNTETLYVPVQGNQEVFFACEGNSVYLDPGLFDKYRWTIDNSTNRIFVTTTEDTYKVQLGNFNGSCTYDTIQARFYPLPTVWLGNDTLLFGNQIHELDAYDPDFTAYKWYSNNTLLDNEIFATYTVDGLSGNRTIKVTVTDFNGCENSDEISISSADYDQLEVPSAFTPNGDGINDVWYFPRKIDNNDVKPYIDNRDVQVFSRTGKLVWKSNDSKEFWDGRDLNGKTLPMDSYHYIIRFNIGLKTYTKKGSVTIVR